MSYTSAMSILHRSAYLSLSALLAIVPAACGGDDDDDNGGGAADSGGGGQADAGGGTPDSGGGTPDSGGGTPDAAPPVEGQQYLLGLAITAATDLGTFDSGVRMIATVDVADDGSTADFSLQPLLAPQCVTDMPEMSGLPVGDARTEAGIALAADGSFEIVLTDSLLPMGSVGSDDSALPCGVDIGGDLTVTGTVLKTGPCGDVTGTIDTPVMGTATGTFGAVAIDTGTIGPDLPEAVNSCP